jgi:hypothetical protein
MWKVTSDGRLMQPGLFFRKNIIGAADFLVKKKSSFPYDCPKRTSSSNPEIL